MNTISMISVMTILMSAKNVMKKAMMRDTRLADAIKEDVAPLEAVRTAAILRRLSMVRMIVRKSGR